MLSYEALPKEAAQREMPATKLRGILREYLQILILKAIYQNPDGKSLFLTGGTYLRLVHNLRRFSEDLLFYSDKLSKKDFKDLLKAVKPGLKRSGIECKLTLNCHGKSCQAKLVFPKIEKDYQAVSPLSRKQGIAITLEVTRPKSPIKTETEVIAGFGELFPCICVNKSVFFASKIAALNKQPQARHIYDIIFMLLKHFPVNSPAMQAFKLKKSAKKIIVASIGSFTRSELKEQALALQTFLFEEHESDLIINAQEIIPRLAGYLK